MPNMWKAAMNLAGVGLRRAERRGRQARQLLEQADKKVRRGFEQVSYAPRHVRDAMRRGRATVTRTRNRMQRLEDHVIAPVRLERRIKKVLSTRARNGRPLVVGPWTSEVGYEALYWVPFLRWATHYYGVDPSRVIAVSRGGTEEWYRGIAGRYIDIFDLVEPSVFAAETADRRARGDQKQMDLAAFDVRLIEMIQSRSGCPDAQVWHPGLMYQLFRSFWYGDRSLDFFLRHTDFRLQRAPTAAAVSLPTGYTAVKFYTGPAVPDTADNRTLLQSLVRRLASRGPVAVLDTAWSTDEHRDYAFDDIPGVTTLRPSLDPRTNLGVQTQVIAGARQFVGTCGGLAWLAPLLGVPTVAVYENDRYLTAHLYAARYAYRRYNAARFSTLNLSAVRGVDAAMAKAS